MLRRFINLPHMEELLGHSDVSTTMIYTDGLDRGGLAVVSAPGAVRGTSNCSS
jgi:site-specific recombinase XerD